MNFAYRHRDHKTQFIHKGSVSMNEKTVISISSDPSVVASFLDKFSGDWFEVLNFLTKVADEQGVYFDKDAVTKSLASKYAEPV